MGARVGSPVSDDGCGLKLSAYSRDSAGQLGSPVSDDGCGLKLRLHFQLAGHGIGSPVSDDGCGLKRIRLAGFARCQWAHPSAMTGVD